MKPITLAGKDITSYHHVCAFFDSRDEEFDVLGPFFKQGLDGGEKTVHIVDPALMDDHLERLRAKGIDTEQCRECGSLEVFSWDDVYLSGGTFDQDRMIDAIDGVIAAGREAGYPRMRIMGNMGWTLKGNPGTAEVVEFEARVNDVLTRTRQLAVCVYDMSKISGALMMDILRSHPLTLVGSVIRENPFFTPPEQLVEELRTRRLGGEQPKAARAAA